MMLCAVLVGMGAGLVNGLLIAYGRLVPFIVTLAMLVSPRLAQELSARKTQLVTVDAINEIALHKLFGMPLLSTSSPASSWSAGGAQPDHVRSAHVRRSW